jgi:putative ubiquitin-RnfH superfamily antitoxin RatB of RatAB toxin-antitoxin module
MNDTTISKESVHSSQISGNKADIHALKQRIHILRMAAQPYKHLNKKDRVEQLAAFADNHIHEPVVLTSTEKSKV